MPKGKGGKKKRRGKNLVVNSIKTIERETGQTYAKVTKLLGGGRFSLECYYGEENVKEGIIKKNKIGIIRGAMRKRVWINLNDIVLVGIREFEDEKVDIIHKYRPNEIKNIKKFIDTRDLNILEEVTFDEDLHIDNNSDDMLLSLMSEDSDIEII